MGHMQAMVIEQQKTTEIVLSKERLYDRNVVIDMKKLLQLCPLVSLSIFKKHDCNSSI